MAEQQEEVKELSLRDSLEAAWTEDQEPQEQEPEQKEPPEEQEEKPEAEPVKEKEPDVKPVGRGKKEKQPEVEAEAKPTPSAAQSRTAPGSWTPRAREKWAALPAEVQQEIIKRERDIHNGFTELGRTRQFAQDFYDTVAPYQHIIAAEGGQPLAVVNNLMQTAAALYGGSPQQKVATVQAIIKNFGIDIRMLDSALAGDPSWNAQAPQQAQQQPQNIQHLVNAAVQQAMAPIMRGQQIQDQNMQQEVANEIEMFAQDPKNEWFLDVKDTMADLLEVAARQGRMLDLQTAYQHAIMMHGDIAPIVQERALKAKAAEATAKAVAAKRKAVSITGAPAMRIPGQSDSSSIRDDLLAAFEQHENT